MTEILSVFAGLGKTTAAKKYAEVCDLQSSSHRYLGGVNQDYEKIKMNSSLPDNPDWPINYLRAIRGGAMGQYAVILVPSNPDVRNLLQGNDIDFTFVLPEKTDSFRERLRKLYVGRSNNQAMIDAVMGYFDTWSRNPVDYDYRIEVLPEGKYLEDLLLDMRLVKG